MPSPDHRPDLIRPADASWLLHRFTRRQVLSASVVGIVVSALGPLACARTIHGPCRLTPSQTEGPFYPVDDQLDEDSDLTFMTGHPGRAEGDVIYVTGQVQDTQCRPVIGARVEIWQASARGRYRHPSDRRNPVPLDPNFQGWGDAVTDPAGRYVFKTVHPGQYPAGPGWTRPSHVHLMVSVPGVHELVTQMYFAGDPYLERDRIFRAIPPAEQDSVVVRPEAPGPEFGTDATVYRFNLTVR